MEQLRIVMLGTMAHLPFGGHVWVHLNWLRGFNGLGHEVWYVEDDSTWRFDPDKILSLMILFMQRATSRVGWRVPDCPRAGRSDLPPARPAGA